MSGLTLRNVGKSYGAVRVIEGLNLDIRDGEFLVLVGLFQVNTWVATLATTGIILGAAYMLFLYRRVIFGKLTKDDLKSIIDMNTREIAVFAPLIILTILMGVYPGPFLDIMAVSVANLVAQHRAAVASLQAVSVAGR